MGFFRVFPPLLECLASVVVVGGVCGFRKPHLLPPRTRGEKLDGPYVNVLPNVFFVDISFENRRLVEDLSRLLNDIR